MVAQSGVSGQVSFALRDLGSGAELDGHRAGLAQPPASVAKAPTALYALSALGGGFRFETRVVATGRVAQGRVQGDLYLVGGGDPTLDTDALADLAGQLAARGIFGVTGRAYVVETALPAIPEIDPDQPEHVAYNPAISGLNANFNRVHFQWSRSGGRYATQMIARSARRAPAVGGIGVALVDRARPVFRYRSVEGRDQWSVAARALGQNGARWLPVRTPALYAGEIFRLVGQEHNLRLPPFTVARRLPRGTVVATRSSAPLQSLLVGMLRHSTNLTAEVAGLRATLARGERVSRLSQSGRAMTDWLGQRYGLSDTRLENHSGLTTESRTTAAEMVALLHLAAREGPFGGMLKQVPLSAEEGKKAAMPGVEVRAKTGTLNFARGLAGYLTVDGRRLAFAYFASDLSRRQPGGDERPAGAASWRRRALLLEAALLRHWARSYGARG